MKLPAKAAVTMGTIAALAGGEVLAEQGRVEVRLRDMIEFLTSQGIAPDGRYMGVHAEMGEEEGSRSVDLFTMFYSRNDGYLMTCSERIEVEQDAVADQGPEEIVRNLSECNSEGGVQRGALCHIDGAGFGPFDGVADASYRGCIPLDQHPLLSSCTGRQPNELQWRPHSQEPRYGANIHHNMIARTVMGVRSRNRD